MKDFGKTLVLIPFLILFGCHSYDDGINGGTIDLSITDAFVFDNQENYVVGDTLFFELKFSRYLPEQRYSELLDVFETTGSEAFIYSLGLSKFSEFSGTFDFIDIDPEFILAPSLDDMDYFGGKHDGNIAAFLNEEQSEYTSNVVIILAEEGRYTLDFNYVRFSSNYNQNNINIDIYHNITPENMLATEFTVTEN